MGAGPAGLTAGIYAGRMGLKTVVVSENWGGMAAEASLIENYPGFLKISGLELCDKIRVQCEKHGTVMRIPETVTKMDLKGKLKKVETDSACYNSNAVILATGCEYRKLGVPGEAEFKGRGVSYCATCDGPLFKGKKVLVIGGGNSAVAEALHLKDLAGKVFLVHRRGELRADAALRKQLQGSSVEVVWNSVVKAVEGDRTVRRVRLFDKSAEKEKTVEVDGVFIYVGEIPRSQIAADAGVHLDAQKFIIVNRRQETNLEGIYAAGDIAGGVRQIGKAVGEGIVAAVNAYSHIKGITYGAI